MRGCNRVGGKARRPIRAGEARNQGSLVTKEGGSLERPTLRLLLLHQQPRLLVLPYGTDLNKLPKVYKLCMCAADVGVLPRRGLAPAQGEGLLRTQRQDAAIVEDQLQHSSS